MSKQNIQLVYDTILTKLQPEQFYYANFATRVIEQDKHLCTTVGCIAGWFPKYFPNSGFEIVEDDLFRYTLQHKDQFLGVKHCLCLLLGESSAIISYLFYGNPTDVKYVEGKPLINTESYLEEVKKAWEWVLENYDELTKDKIQEEGLTGYSLS